MTKRQKIRMGDIFRLDVAPEKYGFGQVLLTDILQFIVIFEPLYLKDEPIEAIRRSNLLLAGWTSDALFWHGRWKIVGNLPPLDFEFPEYIVDIEGRRWVTDVTGNCLRLATPHEARKLTFRFSSAPIAFEKAFKAHHGILPWEPQYEKLRVRV